MRNLVTSRAAGVARSVLYAVVTPLLEKNVMKTMATDAPVVFSMARVIVLGFAVAMLRQIWHAGVAGWPEATLSVAIVLSLPVLSALQHVKPSDVLELSKVLIGRFGIGGAGPWSMVHGPSTEPSKFDDHRIDE
jgi:hypothetical protein